MVQLEPMTLINELVLNWLSKIKVIYKRLLSHLVKIIKCLLLQINIPYFIKTLPKSSCIF